MPKEQPRLSQCGPGTSSKNAKDKSNSATLLALRGTEDRDGSSRRGSLCNSEKDSGYSDNGSDWQQTDVEDRRSSVCRPRGGAHGEAPRPGQRQGQGQVLTQSRAYHTPIYIIKNVVLKQDMIQNGGQLPWGNGGGDVGGPAAPRVILLQQPRVAQALPSGPQHRKPQPRKTGGTGKKTGGTFLPILNSYPRIAPHPSKKPPDKTSSCQDSQNLSKRVCTEDKRDDTSSSGSVLRQHLCKQPDSTLLGSGLLRTCSYSNNDSHSSSSTTVSSSLGSSSVSSLDTPSSSSSSHSSSPFLATKGPHRNGLSSSRDHRFLNTVEILSQSGLLDITLRTQDLLRQSNATEHDIAQLRQHTQLLCQAASNPNNTLEGNVVWEMLHQAMVQSGGYPGLKNLQNRQISSGPDSASQPNSGSMGDTLEPIAVQTKDAPPSPLLTTTSDPNQRCPVPQQSHVEQGREHKASGKPSEKVTIMPPDSSTGWDVL
ncbi:CLOCK-interacting pacemaker isoform 2-T4 [Polymixia lowei]